MSSASSATESAAKVVKTVEQEGKKELNQAIQKDADSTDSNLRYAAYLRRLRDVVRAGSRYTAYTSDIGEAFRPVVPPWVVTAGYGVSWAYLIGDVSYETYKAKQRGPSALEAANFAEPTRLTLVAVKRATFQSIASMALPAFTIHTAVKQASKALAKSSNVTLKRWGPTAVGISIVPALPYLFDKPVEHAVDFVFDKIEDGMMKNKPESENTNPT